jgi:Holliday junction resolvase RusA-like endonuclease
MFIKGKFTSLNNYISAERTNRYKAAALKKAQTQLVYYQVRGLKIETPCKIKMTWHIKDKRTDPDNIAFAKKYILDGLVQANVIPDDTFAHIKGFVDEFVVSKEVGVKIERIET